MERHDVRQRVTRIFCGRKAGAIGGYWRGSRKGGSISIVYFGLTLWWRRFRLLLRKGLPSRPPPVTQRPPLSSPKKITEKQRNPFPSHVWHSSSRTAKLAAGLFSRDIIAQTLSGFLNSAPSTNPSSSGRPCAPQERPARTASKNRTHGRVRRTAG
jgi:hypothetical protein